MLHQPASCSWAGRCNDGTLCAAAAAVSVLSLPRTVLTISIPVRLLAITRKLAANRGKKVPKHTFGGNLLFAVAYRGRKYGPIFFTLSRLRKILVHHNTNNKKQKCMYSRMSNVPSEPRRISPYPRPVRPRVVQYTDSRHEDAQYEPNPACQGAVCAGAEWSLSSLTNSHRSYCDCTRK